MTFSALFKVWATVLAAVLAATLLSAAAFTPGAGAQETGCKGQVVLDAGHGGTDSGAVNTRYGLTEKEQTLNVAKRLDTLLEGDGYTVCMTRTSNSQTLSNNARYTYANTTGADVLVSIHMNGSTNGSTDYTTTLFGKWRKDKELANTIFGSLSTLPAASGTGTIGTRTPYSFASGVLLKSNMPATIAETVFITSDREGQLLSNGTGARQQQIAQALRVGIEEYLATH
ncbi:MAG: N-acetylmuramoyl-L-alanine amidase [Actinomycetota bacterium]|nr:N-acetylmuramoyl-L-alanine amidase [Actinomycetota bacterium]